MLLLLLKSVITTFPETVETINIPWVTEAHLETDRSTVCHIKSFEDVVSVPRYIWQE